VKFFVSLLLLGAAVGRPAAGQDRPAFVWQGKVDGVAILYLHTNRLDVKVKEGAPVAQQQFHFYHSLPQANRDVRLRVLEGRGYVHVVDQPTIDNQFTLAVSIEDRQEGSSFYSIALYWDTSDRLFDRSPGEGRTESMVWSGRIEGDAVISCQAKTCTSSASAGAPIAAEHFKFTRPLPERAVEVTLEEREGRGEIRLVEQPSERNHYTARVSIHDPHGGSSDYSFRLLWSRPTGKEPPPIPAGPGLTWSGSVSGHVRVVVRAGAAISQALDGGRVSNTRTDFIQPLPARSDLQLALKTLRGRGRVQILETPSQQNNYQLIFEIDDPGPGADSYEVELDW
jgi:hypothetical protein